MTAPDKKTKKPFAPKQISEWAYPAQLWQVRLTADGKTAIGTGYDSTIQRWDVSAKKEVPLEPLLGHNGWVQGMALHPKLPRLYSADSWGRLCCWNLADAKKNVKPIWQRDDAHKRWIRDVAISPDGKWLATCGDNGEVRLWSAVDGKPVSEIAGHTANVFCIRFHPTKSLVVTGDLEGKLRVLEVPSGKMLRELDASWLYQHHRIQHCGGVRCMAFDGAGKTLVVGGQMTPVGAFANGTPGTMAFDFESGKKLKEISVGAAGDGFMYDVQFHPDGFFMGVSCAFPGKGHLWCWKPNEDKPFLMDKAFNNGRSLALFPDRKRVLMLVSNSPNGNGRRLKDGKYQGGDARLRLLQLGD